MRVLGLPVLVLAVLGAWLVLPFVSADVPAQDAIPLLVAGDLVRDDPEDVYNEDAEDLYDLGPRFREATCEAFDDPARCQAEGVAFVSTPAALPVLAVVALLPTDIGVLLIRLSGALAMAVGFVLLVRRCGTGDDLLVPLTIAAALLLPEVAGQVELGQTSPLLFVLACLPVSRLRSLRTEVGVAALVALAVAFKGFPAVLLIPMLAARRTRLVALATAAGLVLAVTSVALGGLGLWSDFVDLSRTVAEVSRENPYNAAPVAIAEALGVPAPAAVGFIAGAGVLVAGIVWVPGASDDEDLRWAAALPLVLVVLPQVWSHYVVTAIPLVVTAAARHTARPERWLLGAVAVLVPYSAFGDAGTGWQLYGFLYVVASIAAAGLLVRRRSSVTVAIA